QERERLFGGEHLSRGPLEPEPADVLAEGLAVAGPEGAVEVSGVHVELSGDRPRRERLAEPLARRRADALDPALRLRRDAAPPGQGEELEGEALDRERREGVRRSQLPADAKRDERPAAVGAARDVGPDALLRLDDDDRRARPAEPVRMR